jgi:hypothetical protein
MSKDGSAISQAVVVMNARPALWDVLAREHTEVRTRSVRNRRLLDWSVMKVRPVAVVMSGDAVDVSCVRFPCS